MLRYALPLLALSRATAQVPSSWSTCGDVKSKYSAQSCCGNPTGDSKMKVCRQAPGDSSSGDPLLVSIRSKDTAGTDRIADINENMYYMQGLGPAQRATLYATPIDEACDGLCERDIVIVLTVKSAMLFPILKGAFWQSSFSFTPGTQDGVMLSNEALDDLTYADINASFTYGHGKGCDDITHDPLSIVSGSKTHCMAGTGDPVWHTVTNGVPYSLSTLTSGQWFRKFGPHVSEDFYFSNVQDYDTAMAITLPSGTSWVAKAQQVTTWMSQFYGYAPCVMKLHKPYRNLDSCM